MMHYYGAFGVGLPIHCFFALVFFMGLVMFIVWAARVLDKKLIRKWMAWLLVVGLFGMILSGFLNFTVKKWGQDFDYKAAVESVCNDSHDSLKTAKDWKKYLWSKVQDSEKVTASD